MIDRVSSILFAALVLSGAEGCSATNDMSDAQSNPSDAQQGSDSATNDSAQGSDAGMDGASTTLGLSCAATKGTFSPNACPAPSGAPGQASFCFRPQWPGVTGVEIYGAFNQAGDWKMPFTTLKDDGSGTFTTTVSLPTGAYAYIYRVHGTADNLVKDGQYLLDQENPNFVPPPVGAPLQRSMSNMIVPQKAASIHHLRGTVVYEGKAQPCFMVSLEAGELRKDGGANLSEHTTANFAESAADGTFDFPVADGELGVIVRYPFLLTDPKAPYPDPMKTPSIGYARTGTQMMGADIALDPVEVSYPLADYQKLSPLGPTSSLPVTFSFTLVPGSVGATPAVISTNIAGNDPLYWLPLTPTTSVMWDGTFGGMGKAQLGTKYWWGTWQKRQMGAGTAWNEESLLFPITFQ